MKGANHLGMSRWKPSGRQLAGGALLIACATAWVFSRSGAKVDSSPAKGAIAVIDAGSVACGVWSRYESFSGAVRAEHEAALSSESGGLIERVSFESGQVVHAGEILVQLKLNDAPGVLSGIEADLTLAQRNLARGRLQRKINVLSQEELDGLEHAERLASSRLAAQRALIAQKTVRAPFDGVVGLRTVDPGQYLPPGGVVVSLVAQSPLLFDFSVPQSAFSTIRAGEAATVDVEGANGSFGATVSAIPPLVGGKSRNLNARATLNGAPLDAASGMFGTIRLLAETVPFVKMVDRRAVTVTTHGDTLFVLKGEGPQPVARQIPVAIKGTDANEVWIEGDAACGAPIVLDGQLKIESGDKVQVAPHA
jgi:RND family efflux transporter MFP subunit